MFILMRRWLDRRNAIFAAVLYAVNPYHLVIVYWRSAFAELLASCLVPLLLLFVLKAVDEGRRVIFTFAIMPLALVLAAAWLTNAPAAVMIHYSMALLLLYFAGKERSPRLLFVGALAVGLGALLSAFYLLPAIYEQRWIKIAQAVSEGSRPVDNFLFIRTSDADHDKFNRIISWIAVLEMTAIFAAAGMNKLWVRSLSNNLPKIRRDVWNVLLGWGAACTVLMLPVSALLWRVLPKMQFMQFPWRWLLCLSMIFTIFVAVGMRRWWWRGAVCAISILVIVMAWQRIQTPWWDNAGDLREMQDNMDDRVGYEGTDEYTPSGADPGSIDKNARDATVAGPAHSAIRVSRWDPESKTLTAEMSAPDQLALRLFRYPAWQAEVNGHVVETASGEAGQMLVPVDAGMNRVQVTFVRTWDRAVGGWISLLTAAALIVWTLPARRRTA